MEWDMVSKGDMQGGRFIRFGEFTKEPAPSSVPDAFEIDWRVQR